MRVGFWRCVLFMLKPLRRRVRRWHWFERVMQIQFKQEDAFQGISAACEVSGKPLGAYYYWKIVQATQIMILRGSKKHAFGSLIAQCDASDYSPLEARLSDPRGCLLAIPHYGAFVLSILAVAERVRHQRPVYVFYDPPKIMGTNEIFDVMYRQLFVDGSSGVTVIHNDRAGLATAIRQLAKGSCVIIMPDVYRNRDDAFQVPFFERTRNVMLGVATLARRANANILPLVSEPAAAGLDFCTRFGEIIESDKDDCSCSQAAALYDNYRVTLLMFRQYESLMRGKLFFWQYAATHFRSSACPQRLKGDALNRAAELLPADPRLVVELDRVIFAGLRRGE